MVPCGAGSRKQNPQKIQVHMNKSTRLLITAAAMTGLYAGALATRSFADDTGTAAPKAPDASKHDCKGKNACKGQGGCKSGDNGCKTKNSCQGHGGCKTSTASDPAPAPAPAPGH
jgi:hypothetical protein